MQLSDHYYSFIGTCSALEFQLETNGGSNASSTLDNIRTVRLNHLKEMPGAPDAESFQSLFTANSVLLVEAFEQLRQIPLYSQLNPTLLSLLDSYYDLAEFMMGGGGPTGVWPYYDPSFSGSGNSSGSSSGN